MSFAVKISLALVSLSLAGCASVRVVARETNPVEKEIFVEKCGWSSDLEVNKTEVRVSDRGTIGVFMFGASRPKNFRVFRGRNIRVR